MPEILEVEMYRRLASSMVGRRIREVHAPDTWFLKGGIGPRDVVDAVTGARLEGVRRRGKLLMLDLDGDRPVLGLRFGMTGRLLADGRAAIERLQYGPAREDPAWTRFVLRFDEGDLELRDPRRLGGVLLDPDEDALGPDAWEVGVEDLRRALAGGQGTVKARLMDQARIAGLGNLLTDEILWRAGLDPARSAGSLRPGELERLAVTIRETLDELFERGGSHTGDLQEERRLGGRCPRDGAELLRRRIAGRTTYSCPEHQR